MNPSQPDRIEEPPVPPTGPPPIPPGPLWLCLLLPAMITVLAACSALGIAGTDSDNAILLLFVGPLSGLLCTPWFVCLMRPRYRGTSLVLMSVGYAIGQIAIITPTVTFGTCVVALSPTAA